MSHMLVSEITALMASRVERERRLTVLASTARPYDLPESKQVDEDM